MKKHVLSIVFALCMVVSLFPTAAFAAVDTGIAVNNVVDDVDLGAVTSYTFTNVTGNHTISASFTAHVTPSVIPRTGNPSSVAWLILAFSAALLLIVGKQRGIIKVHRK